MKNVATYQTDTAAVAANRAATSTLLKASTKYMVDALGEGIKQSLNGMDINVEFITLTVRSVAQASGKGVKKLIEKYSAAGRQVAQKRFHYNTTTTLSHS
ncbi:hypothetical protein [Mucilaginibacter psychrotolerans]|uniref:Uncharacterized protein n=1 Tax=Mucilaginibacter psychrotolerans TaxID=1524096 RepID=A0A4Y8SJA8_9SPHI|nr:hypothetical protein [Mucilaginibacter psychrotolerans]TFF39149.1 hypothetical protein E2R66_05880 [Mucilaginibacter psychrotolerans]